MALLDYFHLVCGKDYKLFTVGELAKSGGANVTEEEIVAIIDRLDKDGYVDLDKYQWNPYHTETKDDYISQLQRLKQLLDAGVITQQEFDEKKKALLK